MRIFSYLTILLIISTSTLLSQDYTSIFDEGNKAYNEKNYKDAIKNYLEIVNNEMASSELYYNLGNAYKRNNQLAFAILYYEKALTIAPSNDNIKNNLTISREEVDSDLIEIPDFLPIRMWRAFANVFSPLVWIICQIILGFIFLYGIFSYLNNGTKKRSLFISGLALLALIIVIPAGHTAHRLIKSSDNAIVLEDIELKNGPDTRTEPIETLSEGMKVKIIDNVDDWYQVRLMNKEIGWLQKEHLGVI